MSSSEHSTAGGVLIIEYMVTPAAGRRGGVTMVSIWEELNLECWPSSCTPSNVWFVANDFAPEFP